MSREPRPVPEKSTTIGEKIAGGLVGVVGLSWLLLGWLIPVLPNLPIIGSVLDASAGAALLYGCQQLGVTPLHVLRRRKQLSPPAGD